MSYCFPLLTYNYTVLYIYIYTRWFKYDRDCLHLFTHKSVPVIFEPPCIYTSCGGNVAEYLNCCSVCVCIYIYIYIQQLYFSSTTCIYVLLMIFKRSSKQFPTHINSAWLVGLFNEGAACLLWGTSWILDTVYINCKPQMLSYSLWTHIHSLGIKPARILASCCSTQGGGLKHCVSLTELQDMKRYDEVKVRIHSFLNSALDGDVWSPLHFNCFYCIFFFFLSLTCSN